MFKALMRRFQATSFFILLVILLGVTVGLRFWGLGDKPLHADEAVQAYKLGELLEGKGYVYDPIDHHGPVLYYLEAAVCCLAGQNSFAELTAPVLRIVPALFGVLLVMSVFLWRLCGVRNGVLGVAVFLAAVSPVAVYYSRYFIQETILVACFWAAVPLWWRLCFGDKDTAARKWALSVSAGILFGLAIAAKETWVLMFGAVLPALAVIWGVSRRHGRQYLSGKELLEAATIPARVGMIFSWSALAWLGFSVGVALLTAAAFYSSFGKNPQGIVDAVAAYAGYFQKALGGPHDKWFGWYLVDFFGEFRLGKSRYILEGLTACSCLMALGAVSIRKLWNLPECNVAAFSLLAGLILLLEYSLISYKTPWLLLGVLPPLWLASGYGLVMAGRFLWNRWRPVLLLGIPLVVIAVFLLVRNCWQLTHRLAADERNPLAYVHTSGDILRVGSWARNLEAVSPDKAAFHVNVIASEYWPLPWYLRFWRAGYWTTIPEDKTISLDAAMVITDPSTEEAVASRLRGKYVSDFLGLRPGVILIVRMEEDLLQESLKQKENASYE